MVSMCGLENSFRTREGYFVCTAPSQTSPSQTLTERLQCALRTRPSQRIKVKNMDIGYADKSDNICET